MSETVAMLKLWHVAFALLSVSGFFLRGLFMMRHSPWLNHPLVRRLPHLVDSALFLLGLSLLWLGPWSLTSASWLQAKLTALLIYIGLGFIALRRGHFSRHTRIVAWLLALLVFAYMLAVAHTKQVWPV